MTQILIIKMAQALIFMRFHFEEKLYVKEIFTWSLFYIDFLSNK